MKILSTAILACLVAIADVQGPQDDPPVVFRAGVEVVEVSATVRGRDGHLVTGLTREDFTVRVDGRPVEIEIFSHEPQPLAVAVLVHTSTWPDRLDRQRAAAKALVDQLSSEEAAVIGSMSDEIALSPHVTADKAVLHRVLDEELWPGPINAVGAVANMAMSAFANEKRRRAIVFIGRDELDRCASAFWALGGSARADDRCVTAPKATERALSDDVMIYGLPLPVSIDWNPARPVMDMSRQTGGGYAELTDNEDFHATMARVVDGLRRDYLIGFTPPVQDDRDHRVEVRVSQSGMTAHARRTFRLRGAQ